MAPPSMSRDEAFAVLDLRGDADASEVARAYRRLARELHPDTGGDVEAFHRLQRAYERLTGDGLPLERSAPPPAPTPRPSRPTTTARHQRFVDDPVAVDAVAWDAPVGDGALDRHALARAIVSDGDEVVRPLAAASRGPGRRPGGLAKLLHNDRTATLTVAPSTTRGRRGHDVEVTVVGWTRRDRRTLEHAPRTDGWVHTRGSSSTTLARVIVPSRDPRATALRVATEIDEVLTSAGWPLQDWAPQR